MISRNELSITLSTLWYGYEKLGTDVRVFSWTLVNGNSKNKIRLRNRGRRLQEKMKYMKEVKLTRKNVPTAN